MFFSAVMLFLSLVFVYYNNIDCRLLTRSVHVPLVQEDSVPRLKNCGREAMARSKKREYTGSRLKIVKGSVYYNLHCRPF